MRITEVTGGGSTCNTYFKHKFWRERVLYLHGTTTAANMSGVSPNAAAVALGIPAAFAGFLRIKYGPSIWQDLAKLKKGLAIKKEADKLIASGTTVVDIYEAYAKSQPDKPFVLYEDASYSYGDIDREANKMVRFIQHSGVVTCPETAAIFMYNEPAYVMTWLALGKLGVKVALLNHNVRGKSLLHCIVACDTKAVICGRDPALLDALMEIMGDLKSHGVTIWVDGRRGDVLPSLVSHFDSSRFSDAPVPREIRSGLGMKDVCSYIFTSGTTGLPKPCNIYNWRIMTAAFVQSAFLGPDDVIYVSLPLYHSSGMGIGLVNAVRVGCTVAVSKHFSASKFWHEVRKFRATEIQYIGEICRYLLAQPPRPDDGQYDHELRVAIGNGLRPDIWEEFQKRFNIGMIAEFFGATEANGFTMNYDGKVGAVGRYTPFFRSWLDMYDFVRYDHDTAEPLRDKNGLCILVPPGEPGLMVFKVSDSAPLTGYKASKAANDKKVLRNVKKNGDLYFNSGDLLSYDKDGYLYFVDRLGDTFRWKGENVATTEVAEVLNKFPGIQEANVYGVKIPGNMDGRAGMAAIVLHQSANGTIDMAELYQYITKNLPGYACPKFLRLMPKMEVTGTFKHKKTDLVKEGFDPNLVSDPLYFMEKEQGTYVPLDRRVLQRVVGGQAKL